VLSGKRHTEAPLIIAGIVLLLLGLLLGVGILYTIGIILIVIGAVLWIVGSTGRAVGGRRHYY
jgi:membrane-bound ClpP family serine protease